MVSAKDKLVLVEAHRDRLWKAMGEIEEYIKDTDSLLSQMYDQKTWIPIAERQKNPCLVPVPTYFDGLAEFTKKLRPIILGSK